MAYAALPFHSAWEQTFTELELKAKVIAPKWSDLIIKKVTCPTQSIQFYDQYQTKASYAVPKLHHHAYVWSAVIHELELLAVIHH
jgi:hypothetical protein